MTNEQLEAQSLESIAAWCKDQSVQLEFSEKFDSTRSWILKEHISFNTDHNYYRIAKPRKFYRVGKGRDGDLILVDNESHENSITKSTALIKWLDERKYYD